MHNDLYYDVHLYISVRVPNEIGSRCDPQILPFPFLCLPDALSLFPLFPSLLPSIIPIAPSPPPRRKWCRE